MSGLDGPFSLDQSTVEQYTELGHALVRGLCPEPEIALYRDAIRTTAARLNQESRPLSERDTYGKAFLQTINLWTHDETVRRFVLAKRFGSVAAQLMGVPSVRLYHDQSLFKEAGGGHTPWHQDQQYWPLDTPHTVTMWMPLVDVTEDMGTMFFASGSHRDGYLGELAISDESEIQIKKLVETKGYPITEPVAMKAGDATFHAGFTLHGAPGNSGTYAREVMTVIYFADGVQLGELSNPHKNNDRNAFFPGLEPGDLAQTSLNPVCYP